MDNAMEPSQRVNKGKKEANEGQVTNYQGFVV
jgi:hypothetical protein